MERARESRWGRGGFLILGMAMFFVLGYVLGSISAVGAVPGDSLKETRQRITLVASGIRRVRSFDVLKEDSL